MKAWLGPDFKISQPAQDASSSHISDLLCSCEARRPKCDCRGEFSHNGNIKSIQKEGSWLERLPVFTAAMQRPHSAKMFQNSDELWFCGAFDGEAVSTAVSSSPTIKTTAQRCEQHCNMFRNAHWVTHPALFRSHQFLRWTQSWFQVSFSN